MEIPNQYIRNLYRVLLAFLIILSLFFVVKLLAEFKAYDRRGSSESNSITLSGHGEVQAKPDIANVSFTINKDGKTIKEAQDAVAVIEKKALDVLKNNKIDIEKDVKTSYSSFNPKYQYVYDTKSLIPCNEFGCPPRTGKNTIVGYQASESITVKIRNTDDVGKIVQELGTTGVSDLNGPNFSIDNEDNLKAEARRKAIDDAREKAKALAKDLGVRLGSIVNFSEGGGYGGTLYYAKDAAMNGAEVRSSAAPAVLPTGENTVSSDVTITYEIK